MINGLYVIRFHWTVDHRSMFTSAKVRTVLDLCMIYTVVQCWLLFNENQPSHWTFSSRLRFRFRCRCRCLCRWVFVIAVAVCNEFTKLTKNTFPPPPPPGTSGEQAPGVHLGPVHLSTDELKVGFSTLLIVFLPNLLVVFLFKYANTGMGRLKLRYFQIFISDFA